MEVEVFCDGSATTADKPGGYAFVVVVDGIKECEGHGHLVKATNNVAELTAAISGLEFILNDPRLSTANSVTLTSDSMLVLKYATGEYLCRKPHLVPLYCRLRQLHKRMNFQTKWVKGHSGVDHNERCDVLAKAAREDSNVGTNRINVITANTDDGTSKI